MDVAASRPRSRMRAVTRRTRLGRALALAPGGVAGTVWAAPSDVDPTFGDDGLVTLPHSMSSRDVQLAKAPGMGMFAVVASTDAPVVRSLHRLEDHGGARASFNGGLAVSLDRANCAGTAGRCTFTHIAVAPGDKIVAAGLIDGVDGGRRVAVARWTATGAADPGFGTGGASISDPARTAGTTTSSRWSSAATASSGSSAMASTPKAARSRPSCTGSARTGRRRRLSASTDDASSDRIVASVAALGSDDRLMIAGTYSISDRMFVTLFRLTAQGEIDGSYGQSGHFWTEYQTVMGVFSLELLVDGTAMMGGMYGWQGWEAIRIGKAWWIEADGKSHVQHLGADELALLPTSPFARTAIIATVSDRQAGLFFLGASVFEPFGLEGRTFAQAVVQKRTPEQLPDKRFAPGSRTAMWRGFAWCRRPGRSPTRAAGSSSVRRSSTRRGAMPGDRRGCPCRRPSWSACKAAACRRRSTTPRARWSSTCTA